MKLSFQFQYTNFDRTHDSYQAFIEGLFGSESFKVHANVLNDDMLTMVIILYLVIVEVFLHLIS